MKEPRNPGLILGGIYASMLAVFVGSVLLDIVYSALLDDVEAYICGRHLTTGRNRVYFW